MDEITRLALKILSRRFPKKAVCLTHQFLDGTEGKPCGFVPNDWDGTTAKIEGQWWISEEKRRGKAMRL